MIRSELVNVALDAIYEKTRQFLQSARDKKMQGEMMEDVAALPADIMLKHPQFDLEDNPRA